MGRVELVDARRRSERLHQLTGVLGVAALTVYDDGGGAALYAGGEFVTAFDSADSYLAKWGCPLPVSITSVTLLPQPGAGGIRK